MLDVLTSISPHFMREFVITSGDDISRHALEAMGDVVPASIESTDVNEVDSTPLNASGSLGCPGSR